MALFGAPVFGSHVGEEQYLLYAVLIGHNHRKPVNTYPDSCCRWHTILQGSEKILVGHHGLGISSFSQLNLCLKTGTLVVGVV